jgi:hypothetical protein
MPVSQKKDFQAAMNQRILYALVAISMSTYFHKNNEDTLKNKIDDFKAIINNNKFFRNALKYSDFSQLDILRRIVIYIIKAKCYFLLPVISDLKYYFLRKGKYSY